MFTLGWNWTGQVTTIAFGSSDAFLTSCFADHHFQYTGLWEVLIWLQKGKSVSKNYSVLSEKGLTLEWGDIPLKNKGSVSQSVLMLYCEPLFLQRWKCEKSTCRMWETTLLWFRMFLSPCHLTFYSVRWASGDLRACFITAFTGFYIFVCKFKSNKPKPDMMIK